MVDDRQYGTVVTDVYEHIPDLLYPNSVEIYGQMRRDPQLTAVIDGYTLQLRRAQWQLDGAGCRPEVVQLVADCLGLPIAGGDTPTAFRRRGVSWNEHLRAALLHLVWGHYGFEMAAEIVDGQARLSTLAERIPATIAAIHADPKTGDLLGVDQSIVRGGTSPQIGADRLVWYCRSREGAAWQGNSLLRAAYSPWLIKREMMRVNAISNRRWGAGVPVAEALPGTNPTAAQMAEAQRMASAARAGDQAGAAVPPGFALKILGLSGAVPDTLGFIRFLNQEMSRSVLMQHLDLGSTESGSRALGTAFIDSWTMALETEGEQVADTATRQIAARIVSWNWGNDEPVPRVVVSGVGSRREVTAESLRLLLSSGALSSDPGLEAWVRREYRLPERQGLPEPTPTARSKPAPVENDDTDGDADTDRQVEAAAPATDESQADYEAAVENTTQQWEAASGPLVTTLTAVTAAELAGGMLIGLGALAVPPAVTAELAALLSAAMLDLARRAARRAAVEVGSVVDVDPALPADIRQRLQQAARATVDLIVSGYSSGAARLALANAGTDVDPEQVAELVRQHLADLSQAKTSGLVHGNLAAMLTTAQAAGRETVLAQLPAGIRFRASERHDKGRCGPCGEVDGTEYDTLAAALADYPTGKYRWCLGRDRCRGQIDPILPDGRR